MLQKQLAFVRQKLDWSAAEIVQAQQESPEPQQSGDSSLLDLSRRLSQSKNKSSTPAQNLVKASELQGELSELKEEYEYLDLQKCALEASFLDQSEVVRTLEEDNSALKEDNASLRDNVEELTQDNIALTTSLKSRADQADELLDQVDSLNGQVQTLTKNAEDKDKIIEELRSQIESLQEAIKIHGATPGMEGEVASLAKSLVQCMILMNRAEQAAAAPAMMSKQDLGWQRDADIKDCNGCKKRFGGFFRRHHCRACGDVYCNSCASRERMTFDDGRRERCCTDCFNKFVVAQKGLRKLNRDAASNLAALESAMNINADDEWNKHSNLQNTQKGRKSNNNSSRTSDTDKENSISPNKPFSIHHSGLVKPSSASYADIAKRTSPTPYITDSRQQHRRSPLAPRSPLTERSV